MAGLGGNWRILAELGRSWPDAPGAAGGKFADRRSGGAGRGSRKMLDRQRLHLEVESEPTPTHYEMSSGLAVKFLEAAPLDGPMFRMYLYVSTY
jgi:hypothetical protein